MNIDSRAVHVHFAVPDSVEPRPCERRLAILHARRDVKLELIEAVHAISAVLAALMRARVGTTPRLGPIAIKIADRVRRATLFDALDDIPVHGVFDLFGIGLVCDANLAGAAAMCGRVETVAVIKDQVLA